MPTEATIRKRRNRQDAYLDLDDNPLDENGLLKDGRSYRSSMMMADFGAFIIDSHAVPPRSSFVYKRGYLSDQRGHIVDQRVRKPPMPTGTEPELSRGAPWPTANSGLYSYWQHQIGEECICPNGEPGVLTPHPNQSSLYCRQIGKDAATVDSTTAYYAMKDAAQNEWRRYRPRPLHDCGCSGARDQQGNEPGFVGPPQKPWITGQSVGQECMTDDKKQGRLVLENGRYVCRAIQNGDDHRTVDARGRDPRDIAYEEMVRDAQTAWRNPW